MKVIPPPPTLRGVTEDVHEDLVRWLMADVFGALPTLTLPDWAADAACAGMDTDLFFPEQGGAQMSAAKAVCDGCPVRADCLEFALDDEGDGWHRYGVWGGLTPSARRTAANNGQTSPAPAPPRRPTCECGGCKTCKGRARKRRQRAHAAA